MTQSSLLIFLFYFLIKSYIFWYNTRVSNGDIPKHGFLTQHRCCHQKHDFFHKTVISLDEYLIDLWCGPMRARFDENAGVGLKTHVQECPLSTVLKSIVKCWASSSKLSFLIFSYTIHTFFFISANFYL